MSTTAKLPVKDSPVRAVQDLLGRLLADEEIVGVFTPRHLPARGAVMPALITDPGQLEDADPISPSFPLNAARQVARLTRGELEGTLAAVLRACEIRAFVELVKLNQGSLDNVLLVGVDCYGAFSNQGYRAWCLGEGDGFGIAQSDAFLRRAAAGEIGRGQGNGDAPGFATACAICEHPVCEVADLQVGLFGVDTDTELLLLSGSPRGEAILNRMGYRDAGASQERTKALKRITAQRGEAKAQVLQETAAATDSPAKLAEYLAQCINCYNCRVACPVCYCKECVFVTDVFEHEPWQFLGWARSKGSLRMPTDTLFYHLTRMAHMSTSCVGCGQCSNVCPSSIGIMELFRLAADKTQAAFDYEAGRSPDEKLPLATFNEQEFPELTGGLS